MVKILLNFSGFDLIDKPDFGYYHKIIIQSLILILHDYDNTFVLSASNLKNSIFNPIHQELVILVGKYFYSN